MAKYVNPLHDKTIITPEAAGQLVHQRFVFDLAAAAGYRPATAANGDQFRIGVIPRGYKLLQQLSLLRIPQIDSNGAPTGDHTVGTAADPDALTASAAAETAVNVFGEDYITATASDLGSRDADTEVLLTLVNNVATLAPTGKIIFEQVCRPWDGLVD